MDASRRPQSGAIFLRRVCDRRSYLMAKAIFMFAWYCVTLPSLTLAVMDLHLYTGDALNRFRGLGNPTRDGIFETLVGDSDDFDDLDNALFDEVRHSEFPSEGVTVDPRRLVAPVRAGLGKRAMPFSGFGRSWMKPSCLTSIRPISKPTWQYAR